MEGENLFFVQQNLAITAPRLYAIYYGSKQQLYIVMELLPGQDLQTLWPKLTENDKALIMRKLRTLFDRMRRLRSPGFYGDVCQCKIPGHLFYEHSGPFKSEHDFNMALTKKARKIRVAAGFYQQKNTYQKSSAIIRQLSLTLICNKRTSLCRRCWEERFSGIARRLGTSWLVS